MECGENNWALHRGRLCRPLGVTALNPLFIFSARGTHLEGGNRGVQKCDSVDSLSLVIKCLEGGGHELEDSTVRTSSKRPSSPGDQVNTHTTWTGPSMVWLVRELLLESLVRGSNPLAGRLLLEYLVRGWCPTCLAMAHSGLEIWEYRA